MGTSQSDKVSETYTKPQPSIQKVIQEPVKVNIPKLFVTVDPVADENIK